MQPDQQGVFFQLVIQGGGEFVYDASGNLRSANVGQVTTDPLQGITCQQGFSTFNGHGAVINLLSTSLGAFFQYQDLGTSSQGGLILAVASASGTDPVDSTAYGAGLNGIDPVFGDFFTSTGASINLGLPTFTRNMQIRAQQASDNAHSPFVKIDSPEQTTAQHAALLMLGASPDGVTKPEGQVLIGNASGAGTLSPATNSLLEIQGTAGAAGVSIGGGAAGSSALAINNDVIPSIVFTSAILWAAGGTLQHEHRSGLSGAVPAVQVDHTTFTVTAATDQQASKQWNIPGGALVDANVDSVYRLTVWGFGTEGSTAQNLTVGAALNGNTIRSVALPAITASASFRFKVVIDFHILTTGAGGTYDILGEAAFATVTAAPAVSGVGLLGSTAAGGEAINTTIANNVSLNLHWAAVTGAPTITTFGSMFERLGP